MERRLNNYDSYYEYLHLEPIALMKKMSEEFDVDLSDLQEGIQGIDHYRLVQKKMWEVNADYSFLITALAYAKIELRRLARIDKDEKSVESKRAHEDMTDRIYCIDTFVNRLKKQSETISRMLTARQEENKEMNMNTGC